MMPNTSGLSILLIFFAATRAVSGQIPSTIPHSFPIPEHVTALSQSITPLEYSQITAAIEKESAKPSVSQELEDSPGLGSLDLISGSRILLGSLGEGVIVEFGHSPACGTGGCPMWVLVRHSSTYEVLIRAAGWGYSLADSAGPVPDIVFFWHMSADETDVSQYHFANGKFIPIKSEPTKCGDEDSHRGICSLVSFSQPVWSITLAEYQELAAEMKAKSGADLEPDFASHAHALDFPLVNDKIARVIGIGDCTRESNCAISIHGCNQTYPNRPDSGEANVARCQYWSMLAGVRGWGVADVSDRRADPFSPRVSFVISQGLSPKETALQRYSASSKATGPRAATTLAPDGCEIVVPRTGEWPSSWDPQRFTIKPGSCPQ